MAKSLRHDRTTQGANEMKTEEVMCKALLLAQDQLGNYKKLNSLDKMEDTAHYKEVLSLARSFGVDGCLSHNLKLLEFAGKLCEKQAADIAEKDKKLVQFKFCPRYCDGYSLTRNAVVCGDLTSADTLIEQIKGDSYDLGKQDGIKQGVYNTELKYSQMGAVGYHDAKYNDWSHVERIGWDAVIMRPPVPAPIKGD
jgi:hypothetical protein